MKTIVVTYAGDTFYPPPDAAYEHEGQAYTLELMHMEIRDGMVKSHMRAIDVHTVRYFEFRYTLPTSAQAEDNVLPLHPQHKARA